MTRSLWRKLLYYELQQVTLTGDVIDLGGGRHSIYHTLIQGSPAISVANLEAVEERDLSLDLECPFPIEDASYTGVLCINVLEHIFNYQNVLTESHRILKKGGTAVFAVPFLIRVHPSPHDYWRFTNETLERLFTEAGFTDISVRPIGTGVCGAAYSLKHNLYRFLVVQKIGMYTAVLCDSILKKIKKESYISERHYPLGYLIIARRK